MAVHSILLMQNKFSCNSVTDVTLLPYNFSCDVVAFDWSQQPVVELPPCYVNPQNINEIAASHFGFTLLLTGYLWQ